MHKKFYGFKLQSKISFKDTVDCLKCTTIAWTRNNKNKNKMCSNIVMQSTHDNQRNRVINIINNNKLAFCQNFFFALRNSMEQISRKVNNIIRAASFWNHIEKFTFGFMAADWQKPLLNTLSVYNLNIRNRNSMV